MVALPFTAPFPTCDASTLFALETATGVDNARTMVAIDDASRSSSPGPLLDEESFKDVIATELVVVPFQSEEGRSAQPLSVTLTVVRPPLVALRL